MAEKFICECGWDKGISPQSLKLHKTLHCPLREKKDKPKAEAAAVESEEPRQKAEVDVTALKAELDKAKEELRHLRARQGQTEAGDIIEFGSGAKYENIGQCITCHSNVYKCVTHPLRDDGAIGNRLAVYVAGARPPTPNPDAPPEPPTLYCQMHDPTRHLRKDGITRKPGEPLREEFWDVIKAP